MKTNLSSLICFFFSAEELIEKVADDSDLDIDMVRWDMHVWVLLPQEDGSNLLLQQLMSDEVTRCLELDQSGRWMDESSETLKAIQRAFQPWLPFGWDEVGAHFWQCWDENCK